MRFSFPAIFPFSFFFLFTFRGMFDVVSCHVCARLLINRGLSFSLNDTGDGWWYIDFDGRDT